MAQISTLEPTRYEITARHPDGREILIGYTPRLSRPGLLAAMRQHGDRLIAVCQIGEADEISFATKPRIHASVNSWIIGFTGRTQRDCRHDEREFIAA